MTHEENKRSYRENPEIKRECLKRICREKSEIHKKYKKRGTKKIIKRCDKVENSMNK